MHLLNQERPILQKILPLVQHEKLIVRGGIATMIKFVLMYLHFLNLNFFLQKKINFIIRNCCFQTEKHSWLLSDDVDILYYIILPLAKSTDFKNEVIFFFFVAKELKY